jgi:MFS family permease
MGDRAIGVAKHGRGAALSHGQFCKQIAGGSREPPSVSLGGIVGDKIGRYRIIWISILGPLPLTLLLPHVDFFWTGVLTILINLIMASAFASIMIYAKELVSHRIGLVGGLFYGLKEKD